jgi:hypothetical protein
VAAIHTGVNILPVIVAISVVDGSSALRPSAARQDRVLPVRIGMSRSRHPTWTPASAAGCFGLIWKIGNY